MRATRKFDETVEKKMVDIITLQNMLSCGRKTAVDVGIAAGAKVVIGRRVLFNVKKIQQYIDEVSGE